MQFKKQKFIHETVIALLFSSVIWLNTFKLYLSHTAEGICFSAACLNAYFAFKSRKYLRIIFSYIQTYFFFFPDLNIFFILIQDDASQENNMQAEVTGKLKQHFNNTLPKQNNTSAGVSVIMVREINIFIY